ncbi:alpha/beta hydrolase [Lampropedia puyangensis]|uniref:Alpha/beta hydrolase n=1 Tax=Lampropedia puyangensis TaxID=1330072 RepID=A0A4S8F2K7_9BURK|nr:alpha/beta hydrolase [Lampropedia puyangensis]THU01533.1 alpha/beta hydrolase [Lampropedia puyangensis]
MAALSHKTVHANGLEFAYLEAGEGPTALLLHGFPDNAWSWDKQITHLAASGYRVIAPWLRGYSPTAVPKQPFYDRATLAHDVKALVEQLNGGQPVHLVAQDWGAAIGYGALALFPHLFHSAVVMAIPHVKAALQDALSPQQIKRAFHWWFFQIDDVPEKAVADHNFAFIDFLWQEWSPNHQDQIHIAQIKHMLAQPGVITATIGYYRALLRSDYRDPALASQYALLDEPISVPTLALCGQDDVRAEVMREQARFFCGEYQYREIPRTGHFLHREDPTAVNEAILTWLHAHPET